MYILQSFVTEKKGKWSRDPVPFEIERTKECTRKDDSLLRNTVVLYCTVYGRKNLYVNQVCSESITQIKDSIPKMKDYRKN